MKFADDEIEQAVIDNEKFIYYVLHHKFPWLINDEDMVQLARIGLWKACKMFDSDKGKLATIASTCITNEILMEVRRRKTHEKHVAVSLDEPQNENDDSPEITLEDMFPIEEEGFARIEYDIPTFLNTLSPRERFVLLHMMDGDTQQNMADRLKISRSYVSRIVKGIKRKASDYYQLGREL